MTCAVCAKARVSAARSERRATCVDAVDLIVRFGEVREDAGGQPSELGGDRVRLGGEHLGQVEVLGQGDGLECQRPLQRPQNLTALGQFVELLLRAFLDGVRYVLLQRGAQHVQPALAGGWVERDRSDLDPRTAAHGLEAYRGVTVAALGPLPPVLEPSRESGILQRIDQRAAAAVRAATARLSVVSSRREVGGCDCRFARCEVQRAGMVCGDDSGSAPRMIARWAQPLVSRHPTMGKRERDPAAIVTREPTVGVYRGGA